MTQMFFGRKPGSVVRQVLFAIHMKEKRKKEPECVKKSAEYDMIKNRKTGLGSAGSRFCRVPGQNNKSKMGGGFNMDCLKSQRMRQLAPELDPLRIGTGWRPEDLSKPQIMIESTAGDSHPGSGPLK